MEQIRRLAGAAGSWAEEEIGMKRQLGGRFASRRTGRGKLGVLALLLLAWGFVALLPLGAAGRAIRTYIPVIVNYYKDSDFTPQDVKDMIKEANRILKKNNAEMELIVVEENENATDGDDGNGELSPSEMVSVKNEGNKEIAATKNGTGLKISLVKNCATSVPSAIGWSYIGKSEDATGQQKDNPFGDPTIALEDQNDGTKNARNLLHELIHVMSGEGGHTNGADDLSKQGLSGETIPPSRLIKMTSYHARKRFAKCSYQIDKAHPGKRLEAQRGRSADASGDQRSPLFFDLTTTELYSLDGDPTIDGLISVNGLFEGPVDAVFVLTIDADNDATTGEMDESFFGREYSIELWVHGDAGEYEIEEFVVDLTNGIRIALPDAAEITTVILHADGGELDVHDYLDTSFSQLVFAVAKEQIGLDLEFGSDTPADIPVGVFVQSEEGIHDEDSFQFRMDQWLRDPLLETSGNGVPQPGEPYDFNIQGLQPGDEFSLYLDGLVVYTGILGDSGEAAGSFVFPEDLTNESTHSFYAQDSTGEFAYGMTCPKTPDPTVGPPVTTPPPASRPPTTTPPYRPSCPPPCGGDPPIWGDIMVFPTPERFINSDLNGDGDTRDTVLRYQNLRTGVVVNTGLECSGADHGLDIWEQVIVFSDESSQAIRCYDIDTGLVHNTGGAGAYPSIHEGWVAFRGTNGTIQLFDVKADLLFDTEIWGSRPAVYDGVVAFQSGSPSTIWHYNIATGVVTDTGAIGRKPAIYEDLVVFTTRESDLQEDLSGDGDLTDSVIRCYNLATRTTANTGIVGDWPATFGDILVFNTLEAAVSNDLNGDGTISASATVIQYLHLPSGQVTNTGELGAVPDIYDGTITFHALESWSGFDWSGDGDTRDSVVLTCEVQLDGWTSVTEPSTDPESALEPLSR